MPAGERARHALHVASLVVVAVGALLAGAGAQNLSPGGTVMSSPVRIVALYWDSNWDADHAGAFPSGPQPTMDNVDAMMRALGATPISYFAKTAQYRSDNTPFAVGEVQSHRPGSMCRPQKAPSVLGTPELDAWLTCEVHLDPAVPRPRANAIDTLYVLFLPVSTVVRNHGLYESCNGTPTSFLGYHAPSAANGWPFAVIALACHDGLRVPGPSAAALSQTVSHEFIEAMTDPFNSGWQRASPTPAPSFPPPAPSFSKSNEVADVPCNDPLSFFGLTVASYWSNADAGCVVGNSTELAYIAPLAIATIPPVPSHTSAQLTVTPNVPATFSLAAPVSGVGVSPSGTFSVDSVSADRDIAIVASATDGSSRSASGTVRALTDLRISPARSSVGFVPGQIAFHEDHHVPVIFSMTSGSWGSVDGIGVYHYQPSPTAHDVTITARAVNDARTATAFVHIVPGLVAQGTPGLVAVALGGILPIGQLVPRNIHLAPPSLTYKLDPPIGAIRNGAYVAPTRQELVAAGYQPGKPILVQLTALDDRGGTFRSTMTVVSK